LGTRSVFATHTTKYKDCYQWQKKLQETKLKIPEIFSCIVWMLAVTPINVITPHPQEEKKAISKRVPLNIGPNILLTFKHPKYFINADTLQLTYSILLLTLVAVITTSLLLSLPAPDSML